MDLLQNENLKTKKNTAQKQEKKDNEEITEEKSSKKTDLERYKDPYGLSVKKMSFGLWLVENRKHFYFITCGFLIMISVITWSRFLYTFGKYVLFDMKKDRMMIEEMLTSGAPGHDYFLQTSPQNLIFQDVEVIKSSQDKYDFILQVTNSNERLWAEIDYYFSSSLGEFGESKGFILPNETKYLLLAGKEFEKAPRDIRFNIRNINWHRLNRHEYPDWKSFRDEHLNIKIIDPVFTPAKKTIITEKINLNDFKFSTLNNTPFNYTKVDFIIILSSGNKKVIVNRYAIEGFMSGEKREIGVTIPGTFSHITNIDIIPDLNITRKDIYIKFYGGAGKEK